MPDTVLGIIHHGGQDGGDAVQAIHRQRHDHQADEQGEIADESALSDAGVGSARRPSLKTVREELARPDLIVSLGNESPILLSITGIGHFGRELGVLTREHNPTPIVFLMVISFPIGVTGGASVYAGNGTLGRVAGDDPEIPTAVIY